METNSEILYFLTERLSEQENKLKSAMDNKDEVMIKIISFYINELKDMIEYWNKVCF